MKEGGGEEHRTASSPEDDKATEGSDAPDAAEDSGATVSMPGVRLQSQTL